MQKRGKGRKSTPASSLCSKLAPGLVYLVSEALDDSKTAENEIA